MLTHFSQLFLDLFSGFPKLRLVVEPEPPGLRQLRQLSLVAGTPRAMRGLEGSALLPAAAIGFLLFWSGLWLGHILAIIYGSVGKHALFFSPDADNRRPSFEAAASKGLGWILGYLGNNSSQSASRWRSLGVKWAPGVECEQTESNVCCHSISP